MRLWDNAGALKRINNGLYVLVVLSLLAAAVVWMMNSPYFPIKSVKIDGQLQRLDAAQLQQTAQRHIRGNIFKADLHAAREAFEALPWVAEVEIRRMWPDTVQIQVSERQPVARWEGGGLVDSEGRAFDAPTDEPFPVFSGATGARKIMVEEYDRFRAILEPTGLKIERLDYGQRAARTLTLDNGLVLRLGRLDAESRLRRFVQAWHEVLHSRADSVRYVDLRYKDGFAVRYRSGEETPAVPEQAASAAHPHGDAEP
ncbi:cell division protein FtsQ/DivIB [Neisseria shayeganii]|uniref:Cell division protein FtsQ n=1 Tax=Neisseria shayeganii 871 TaxID=1032488 RepID=G4CI43_9NEIS|nr:cell division protein FtsQ/DivIB [Neisseria shayeganii]EGY52444.1 cell division protein [Neisseria shayeganii 871]